MVGHSKWANIKHKKARADAQKGQVFTKISRELMVAAREGGGDEESNFRLRLAIQKARDVNMPNDNISRAIKKGMGEVDGVKFEEMTYEGYGPGGVAILLEVMTDNRNRTASEIRNVFDRHNGNLGESGCVAWMFNRRGYITLYKDKVDMDEDDLMLLVLEEGAEDFKSDDNSYEIITEPEFFAEIKDSLLDRKIDIDIAEVTMVPQNIVKIEEEEEGKMLLQLMESLEEHDDVQNVYANFDLPDEVLST